MRKTIVRSSVRFLGTASLVAALGLPACDKSPPQPEILFGSPGDPAACTLAERKSAFGGAEPMGLVVEMHRPMGHEQVELMSVRVDESGTPQGVVWRRPFQVMRDHECFCIIDPQLVAGTFTALQSGKFEMTLLGGPEVLAKATFEVAAAETAAPQEPASEQEEKPSAEEAAEQ